MRLAGTYGSGTLPNMPDTAAPPRGVPVRARAAAGGPVTSPGRRAGDLDRAASDAHRLGPAAAGTHGPARRHGRDRLGFAPAGARPPLAGG